MSSTQLYRESVDPVSTDGRDIDTAIAELTGEAADQKTSGTADKHIQGIAQTWVHIPHVDQEDITYYERPMLKEPVWGWSIPLYYYVGGLTGASLALGAAAQLGNTRTRESLIARCHLIGFVGASVSGALLSYDLGGPSRFLNMLRVFRPTSPMNVGAWILTATSGLSVGAVLLRPQRGLLRKVGAALGLLGGIAGAALATYTGVLVANSAVPVWQASRKMLPVVFGAKVVASAGAVFVVLAETREEQRITRIFGIAGRIGEMNAGIVMEKQASAIPRVGLPLRQGWTGFRRKLATALTAAGLFAASLPTQTRSTRRASGLLITLGSLLMRYTVQQAGVLSSRHPRASFRQQRTAMDSAAKLIKGPTS